MRIFLMSIKFVLLFFICFSAAARSPVGGTVIASQQQAVTAQASPPGGECDWFGALDAGSFKLRLVLKVSKSADVKLTATLDSLDQNAKDLVVDTITFEQGTLKFEMKALNASYVGSLSKDGAQLTGQF